LFASLKKPFSCHQRVYEWKEKSSLLQDTTFLHATVKSDHEKSPPFKISKHLSGANCRLFEVP
jgi:hypothetical protein